MQRHKYGNSTHIYITESIWILVAVVVVGAEAVGVAVTRAVEVVGVGAEAVALAEVGPGAVEVARVVAEAGTVAVAGVVVAAAEALVLETVTGAEAVAAVSSSRSNSCGATASKLDNFGLTSLGRGFESCLCHSYVYVCVCTLLFGGAAITLHRTGFLLSLQSGDVSVFFIR